MRTSPSPLRASRPLQSPPHVSAAFLLSLILCGTAVIGCGGDDEGVSPPAPGPDGALDALQDAPKADSTPDASADAPDDQSVVPDALDAPVHQDGSADVTTDGSLPDQDVPDGMDDTTSADQVTPEASCQTELIVLGRPGTTSSCSFPVPESVNHDEVNILLGAELCEQGSNNCSPVGGWFWFGDEVALCDETCMAWENSGANLLLSVGCPSESCTPSCSNAGGVCGNGINNCCAGTRCESGTCVACTRGGENCTSTDECCSGSCEGGICVDGLGGTCISQDGCTEGVCRDNRCQCEADQILCDTGCISHLDPGNCRGCGNVCQDGRICTSDGCVCNPATGLPDECNGVCVNMSSDRTNCGFCSYTCPKLEQVCVNSVCGCPDEQAECNGTCVDTETSQSHCGECNHGCPMTVELCTAGVCDCAPGYTRCSGNCVNLLTDKYNCNGCGEACPGNKTCENGTCG